jgi:plastocyanin
MRPRSSLPAALALALLTLGVSGAALKALADEAAGTRVLMKDLAFAPASLTIKAGSVVTWVNKDEEPHLVFSDSGLFHSVALDAGADFRFRFDKPGTYHYLCTIDPQRVGTIVVE